MAKSATRITLSNGNLRDKRSIKNSLKKSLDNNRNKKGKGPPKVKLNRSIHKVMRENEEALSVTKRAIEIFQSMVQKHIYFCKLQEIHIIFRLMT